MSRPWKDSLDFFDFQITAALNTTDDQYDRCIHRLTKPEENPDKLLTITLDWQREFRAAKPMTSEVVKKYLTSAQTRALEYFEDVAEGGRFDEQLVGNPT